MSLRLIAALCLACWAGASQAAVAVYPLAPPFTDIAFAIDHLGLFRSEGKFTRFSGSLALDLEAPARSRVDITIDSRSIHMFWSRAQRRVEDPDYLDAAHFGQIHYVTRTVQVLSPTHVLLQGDLTLRGETRPQVFDAVLEARHWDSGTQGEVAAFTVTGDLRRSDFGMVADRPFVSELVHLQILTRVRLVTAR